MSRAVAGAGERPSGPSTGAVPAYGRHRPAPADPTTASTASVDAAEPSRPALRRTAAAAEAEAEAADAVGEPDGGRSNDGDDEERSTPSGATGGQERGKAAGRPSSAGADGGESDRPAVAAGTSDAADRSGGKVYQFSGGAAPVRTGDGEDGADTAAGSGGTVRPLRTLPAAGAGAGAGRSEGPEGATPGAGTGAPSDDAFAPSPIRALRAVQELSLDRLLGADPETREARNAQLRRVGTRVGAVALAGVLVYAVFPVRTALDQRAAIERSREQIDRLGEANERLEDRAERLSTDEEIERLAREQYNLVMPGEESYGLMPAPDQTTTTTTTTSTTTTSTTTTPDR